MSVPLLADIKNDKRWWHNVLRIIVFLLLCLTLDFLISLVLLRGVERNYGLGSDADVLLIGHSHLMLAVDKELLEELSGLKVAKYTREGVNIADRRVMADHYFNECSEKPEMIILGIDPWLFTGEDLSKNSYILFYPFMDAPEIREYIKVASPSKFDYMKARWIRSSRYNATLLNASIRGWLGNWDNLKTGILDSVRVMNKLADGNFRPVSFNRELIKEFSLTLKSLADKDVRVILLNTPVWQPVVTGKKAEYDRVMHLIDSITREQCPSAEIIDLVPDFSSATKFFFDPIHMNPEGQREVTEVLAEILKK